MQFKPPFFVALCFSFFLLYLLFHSFSGDTFSGGGGGSDGIPTTTNIAIPQTSPPVDEQQQQQEVSSTCPVLPSTSASSSATTTTPTCPHGYMNPLLGHFMDVDFIEFVMNAHPRPDKAGVVIDVGLYQADEVILLANRGFRVYGFEPEPYRFKKCMEQMNETSKKVQSLATIRNAAISNSDKKMYFQMAGLDSHMYMPKEGEPLKEKTIVVETVKISDLLAQHPKVYYLKIDTQGFDTTIVESLFPILRSGAATVHFIQFEFTAFFERTRAGKTKEDHKKIFLELQSLGYDLYQGATVQPWLRSHRGQYGKTPLAMLAVDPDMSTCVDDVVEKLHRSKDVPIHAGSTSTVMGSWMDILAVKRSERLEYYRFTGWVLAKRM